MRIVTYIKDAVNPGGTPTRYLAWVSIILTAQVLASVLPSPTFYEPSINGSHIILGCTLLIATSVLFIRSDQQKIIAAYCLYIVGLTVTTVTISIGITSLSGIIFMLTWAMTLFVAERREYISFDLVTLFMVLMLVSTVILLMYNPSMNVADNFFILATGAFLTGMNIYLVYTDFGYEKNFYQESRKTYTDLEVLSNKLSEILSSEGQLEELLWKVSQECVPLLNLEECVIYLYNPEKNRLIQTAAFGSKTTGSDEHQIINPLELDPSSGIVGKCFRTASTVLIEETKHHPEYVVDDAVRNSELAVPIISNGKVVGVIDSEHRLKGFFRQRHTQAFHIMASFCGIKITEYYAQRSIIQAEEARMEALRYKELDELKNRFITNISHDLKTPLSLIKAPAMQIAKIADDPQIQKHSNYILKNTEHLLRVVNQLLQLNRVDKGLNELYIQEVDAGKLFDKIATQYLGLAEKENVDFQVNIAPATLLTDTFRLEQIVHNLVHNAFRYTGKDGKIALETEIRDNSYVIRIEDSGPGISKELQSKVFERFFKADVNNHEGTGVGLSLVKEYVQSLNGDIRLNSEPGKGSTFEVYIPIRVAEDKEEIKATPDEEIAATEGKPFMLVVEDHADLNNFICTFFENDFHCISAFDGQEALQKIEEQAPDIIISDLMMPNMDGSTFVQQVKTSDHLGHIPVIVLSAKSQTESRVDLYNIGADNYLVKPFDISELDAVVRNVLEQRKRLREKFRSNYLEREPVASETVTETQENAETNQLLSDAVNYVREHMDDSSMSIKDLAENLGIGRNRLQKEIKELTNLTPVEFVRSIRLNEARRKLEDRSLNVSEVAYSVGFNNLSYFTRSFKSEFGVLPSEWQETATSRVD